MTPVIVIIGDVIKSRQVNERQHLQEILQAALDQVNQRYADTVLSPFTITLGDECQAILAINTRVFQIIDEIREAITPFEMRFGIGVGQLKTKINPQISIGADGPAFWYAREAITYVHQYDDYGATQIALRAPFDVTAINAHISANEFIRSKWIDSQQVVYRYLLAHDMTHERLNQQHIAAQLGMTPVALYKRLKSSGIKIYLRQQAALHQELLAACQRLAVEEG